MADVKVTVDQLKNYLGTGLMMEYSGYGEKKILDRWSISVQENWDIHFMDDGQTDDDVLFYFKPICYRLSDLNKEIEHNGERFVPNTKIENDFDIEDLTSDLEYLVKREDDGNVFTSLNKQMAIMQKLFEWHFWTFGEEYFEQGLVIDKRKEVGNG